MTYYASNDTCTGLDKLQDKCALTGGRAAKIDKKQSLQLVQKEIDDNETYWIGLR